MRWGGPKGLSGKAAQPVIPAAIQRGMVPRVTFTFLWLMGRVGVRVMG